MKWLYLNVQLIQEKLMIFQEETILQIQQLKKRVKVILD